MMYENTELRRSCEEGLLEQIFRPVKVNVFEQCKLCGAWKHSMLEIHDLLDLPFHEDTPALV